MAEKIDELKPCPFCGGEPDIKKHTFSVTSHCMEYTFGVKCYRCKVETWQFFQTEGFAIEAWNRRIGDG